MSNTENAALRLRAIREALRDDASFYRGNTQAKPYGEVRAAVDDVSWLAGELGLALATSNSLSKLTEEVSHLTPAVCNLKDHSYSRFLKRMWQAEQNPQPSAEFAETILFTKLAPDAQTPVRKHKGDVGFDLYIAGPATLVHPNEFADVHTNIAVALPLGFWARITGRSSTLRDRHLLVMEGVIDNGYRGELKIGVFNLGCLPIILGPGERIAQLIISNLHDFVWVETEELPASPRGQDGFGSTGK